LNVNDLLHFKLDNVPPHTIDEKFDLYHAIPSKHIAECCPYILAMCSTQPVLSDQMMHMAWLLASNHKKLHLLDFTVFDIYIGGFTIKYANECG
jgi:hypothetical protein